MPKLMIFLTFLLQTTFFGSYAMANGEPSECVTALMSEPVCVSQINAKAFCETNNNDMTLVEEVKGCFLKYTAMSALPFEVNLICLGLFKRSSIPEENESLCNKKD